MGFLPTLKDMSDLKGAASTLEQWRQRIMPLLKNEQEFVKPVSRTFFSTIDAKTVRLHFDPGANADAHDIEWSNDPNFKNAKATRIHGGKDGSARVEIPLFDGFTCVRKYYFRVRAVKGDTPAPWSPTAVFGVPIPGALLDLIAFHTVDNVVEENPLINVNITLPRTALQGAQTILDPEAVWTDHVDLEADWSALAGAIDATQVTFTATAGQGPYFKVAGYYKIEDEIVLVDSVAADVVTVQRGVNDTVAVPHADATVVRFYSRVLREMFSAGNNGTFAVTVTIPNPEKVRMRTFDAWPVNRCGERGPISTYALDLPPPALLNDLVAEPFFQRVVLRWSELPWTAYRYQIFHSTTVPIPIANLDPTLTAGVELLARPLADHEGEATYQHDVKFAAGVVHYYGVRAIDIFGGYNLPTGGDTVGPLQPDENPTNPADDVTGISATESGACTPHSIRSRSRQVPMSSVTVGFTPPAPLGTFARVKIYLQMVGEQAQLNGAITSGATLVQVEPFVTGGQDTGGISRMWGGRYYQIDSEVIRVSSTSGAGVVIVRGQQGTTPAAHADNTPIYPFIQPEAVGAEGPAAPLSFLYQPIGDVTLYFVSVSTTGEENQILASPNLTITLDGHTSPPLEVQNLYCQLREHGVQVSWSEGLECNLDHYDVADMGNVTMLNQADILPRHIVERILANAESGQRVFYNWIEREYEGSMSGGGATIVFSENLFEPDAHNGKSWTFSYVSDGGTVTDTSYTILDTTANTIVLSAIPTESGAAVVRGYVGGRIHKFYVRAVNSSDLASEWRPVEGTFLECSPLAPDGSYDLRTPKIYFGEPFVPSDVDRAWWTAGWFSKLAGKLQVFLAAQGDYEDEPDFNVALKRNIGGIITWEVEVTTDDPSTLTFQFPASTQPGNYKFQGALGVPRPVGFWILKNTNIVDLPEKSITQVRFRAENWFGWGPWSSTLTPQGTASFPAFTGSGVLQSAAIQASISNQVHPNILKRSIVELALTESTTINPPEYIGGGGTPGTGSSPVIGHNFTIVVEQDATGGRVPTFSSSYKGLDGKSPDLRPNRYTAYTFQVRGASDFRLISMISGNKT